MNYYRDFWCNKGALCKIIEYLLSEVEAIAQLYYWTIIKAAFAHKGSKLLWKITTNNPKQNVAIAMLANLVVRLVGALLFNFGGGRSLLDVWVMTSQIILPCWSLCVWNMALKMGLINLNYFRTFAGKLKFLFDNCRLPITCQHQLFNKQTMTIVYKSALYSNVWKVTHWYNKWGAFELSIPLPL